MKKTAVLFAALCLLLISCKGSPKEGGGVVNVFNWGEYMDTSLNDEFTRQTGISVNYKNYQTNEILYSSLKSGGAAYDVVIPSDYMIARLIEEDMLLPIDFANIPNNADIQKSFLNAEYDPDNKYSVPYMWGTVGIIYNTTMISEPVDSWEALFDPKYKAQMLMFDNSRDAFGIALKLLGYSLNTTDEGEMNEAFNLLKEQKPLVQAYVMDQIFDKMTGGEAALAPYYAGDAVTMIDENPDLAFVVPKEGSNKFVDAFCIPKGAENKKNAELYINFMCSKEVGLANVDTTGYSTPLQSVYDALDQEVKDDGISYPPEDILSRCQVFTNLPKTTLDLYDSLWGNLMMS